PDALVLHDPEKFVADPSVDHQPQLTGGRHQLPDVGDDAIRPRRMMNDAEGKHEIEGVWREEGRKRFGVPYQNGDTVAESIHLKALARDLCGRVREFDRCDQGSGTREVDRVGADTATDLEHALAGPPRELGKAGDMRFDEILALLDLIEVFTGADRLG